MTAALQALGYELLPPLAVTPAALRAEVLAARLAATAVIEAAEAATPGGGGDAQDGDGSSSSSGQMTVQQARELLDELQDEDGGDEAAAADADLVVGGADAWGFAPADVAFVLPIPAAAPPPSASGGDGDGASTSATADTAVVVRKVAVKAHDRMCYCRFRQPPGSSSDGDGDGSSAGGVGGQGAYALRLKGPAVLETRCLQALGWDVLPVPVSEWTAMQRDGQLEWLSTQVQSMAAAAMTAGPQVELE